VQQNHDPTIGYLPTTTSPNVTLLFSEPNIDPTIHVPAISLAKKTINEEYRFSTANEIRASPAVLGMWSCTIKLDEGNPTYGSLAQHNCALLPWLVNGIAGLFICRKKCNKDHLTAAQCFWLAHHNDWSRWFSISSPPLICCPSFGFIGEVAKEYITKLGCEKYFLRVTCWALLELL
jgi:hypothetical protein